MNTKFLAVLLGVLITGSVIFVITFQTSINSYQANFEDPFRDKHYSIEITGMKDVYLLGEPYDFSYVLSGYGDSCGSKTIFFIDKDGNGLKEFVSASCIADTPMRDFVFDVQKEQGTTYGNVGIMNPGRYTVGVTLNYEAVEQGHEFVVVNKNCDRQKNDLSKMKCFDESFDSCEPAYMTHQFSLEDGGGDVSLVATVESWNDCKLTIHTENSRGDHSSFNGVRSFCDDLSITGNSINFERCNNADYPSIIFSPDDSDYEKKETTYKIKKYSDELSEVNNLGLIYKNNKDLEKFEDQVNRMQEKQKEIASELLGIQISDAYVAEGWNFPFMNSSDIEPIPGIEISPICDIPENIPTHLETIRDSEMFQMFIKKYSKYPITIDISDERRHNSMIHYTISGASEDGNYHASTYFHLDSCTGKSDPYLNLHCRGPIQGDFRHAYLLENIKDSLDDDSFCTISFEPWQEKLFEYSEKRSAESKNIQQYLHAKTESEELDDISEIFSELKRLELLGRISFEATRNMDDINTWETEDVLEYNQKFGKLPDELLKLIEQRK